MDSIGPGASAGFALWRDAMAWQRRVNRALGRLRLTHTQVLVLSALDSALERADDAVSQTAIATEAGLDRATVSVVLRKLEARGFIDRDIAFGDRRVWRIRITSDGTNALASALPLVEEASAAKHRRGR